jgi:haloacetate dehalogenase
MREQNSATTMNRREMLKLSAAAALIGTSIIPGKIQAMQTVAMKPISLPELPPKASNDVSAKLFPGFVQTEVRTSGATIPVFHKGDGPPVLLLHGYPETHVTWHKVAPRLAARFSVYVPDLRGYGDSSRPSDGDRHINYSFRAMALDQVETMRHFGHEQFLVGAHDRGARVAHRLCLDFPKSVKKVCLMDIAPTLTMYRQTNQEFATKYMWWFFLIQAAPLPEHLIGLDPQYYLDVILSGLNKTPGAITPEALSEYLRCFCCTSTIHGGCEDMRASADIDLEMDEADDHAGNKIVAPVHALWGAKKHRRAVVGRPRDLAGESELNCYRAQSRLRPFPPGRTSRGNLRGTGALLLHSVGSEAIEDSLTSKSFESVGRYSENSDHKPKRIEE